MQSTLGSKLADRAFEWTGHCDSSSKCFRDTSNNNNNNYNYNSNYSNTFRARVPAALSTKATMAAGDPLQART